MLDFKSIPIALKAAVPLLLLLALPGSKDSSAQDSGQEKSVSLLFVATGSSGSLTGDDLILRDVSSVIFFSDRPERLAGQLSIEEFLDMWEQSDFSTNPPSADLNAVLCLNQGQLHGQRPALCCRKGQGFQRYYHG